MASGSSFLAVGAKPSEEPGKTTGEEELYLTGEKNLQRARIQAPSAG